MVVGSAARLWYSAGTRQVLWLKVTSPLTLDMRVWDVQHNTTVSRS